MIEPNDSLLQKSVLAGALQSAVNQGLQRYGSILKIGTPVDPNAISAPSSAKTHSGRRDPQMPLAKKGKRWHFGMKAPIGTLAESGVAHAVVGTAANAIDVTRAQAPLHGAETAAFADAG